MNVTVSSHEKVKVSGVRVEGYRWLSFEVGTGESTLTIFVGSDEMLEGLKKAIKELEAPEEVVIHAEPEDEPLIDYDQVEKDKKIDREIAEGMGERVDDVPF